MADAMVLDELWSGTERTNPLLANSTNPEVCVTSAGIPNESASKIAIPCDS